MKIIISSETLRQKLSTIEKMQIDHVTYSNNALGIFAGRANVIVSCEKYRGITPETFTQKGTSWLRLWNTLQDIEEQPIVLVINENELRIDQVLL